MIDNQIDLMKHGEGHKCQDACYRSRFYWMKFPVTSRHGIKHRVFGYISSEFFGTVDYILCTLRLRRESRRLEI